MNILRLTLSVAMTFGFSIWASQCYAFQIKELKPTSTVYPTLKTISGRVVDESGWPIVRAVVLQSGASRTDDLLQNAQLPPYVVSNRTTTDVRGKFNFKFEALDRKYPTTFRVIHADYTIKHVTPLELFGDIVLSKRQPMQGRILRHDGTPVEDATIQLSGAPSEETLGFAYGKSTTDEDGRFEVSRGAGQTRFSFWLTLPGRFHGNVTCFPKEKDTAYFSPNEFYVVGDDFEFRLPKPNPIEISVVSTANKAPIEVDRAITGHSPHQGYQGFWRPHSHLKVEGSQVSIQYLRHGANRIWIHPRPESKHTAVFVDLVVKPEGKIPAKITVNIPEGAQVSGKVVDEVSGLPLEDVAILYLPTEPGKLESAGIYRPNFIRTTKDGAFSAVLPPGSAKLRIVGACQNYRTLPVQNLNQEQISADASERLERMIVVEAGQDLAVPTFRLEQSPAVSGVVRGEDDRPLADVTLVVEKSRSPGSRSSVFGKTDKNGRFEIDSVFTNAIKNAESKDGIGYFPGIETSIFFWHEDLTLSKRVVVKESELAPLSVKLESSPAAWGRVIDALSQLPVADVRVNVRRFGGIFKIGARSRHDGTFLLEHVPRTDVYMQCFKQGYNQSSTQFSFTGDDKDKLVLELADTKIIKTFAFGKPAPPIDISDMTVKEALEALTKYIDEELEKLPPRPWEGNWNSGDPDAMFRQILADGLTDPFRTLMKENQHPGFQTAVAIALLDSFALNRGGRKIPSSTMTQEAQTVLIKNIDLDGVFEKYRSFEFLWMSKSIKLRILNNSQKPEIRRWATDSLSNDLWWELDRAMRVGRTTDEHFRQTLKESTEVWGIVLSEFPDQMTNFGVTLPNFLQQVLDKLNDEAANENVDEQRSKLAREAIEALLNDR